jgi:KDO2-lipid IV(A) lauroyltransferase
LIKQTRKQGTMLYWAILATQRLLRVMPRRARWLLGGSATVAAYWLWPAKRRATQANMSVVLGLPSEDRRVRATARRSWYNYGRFIADTFDFGNHTPTAHLAEFTDPVDSATTAFAAIDAACAPGRSVILVSGHYGAWEKAGILVAARYPLHVLAEELGDKRLNSEFQAQRRRFGLHIVFVRDGVRTLMQLFKQGAIIGTPVDIPVAPGEGVAIQFFGRTAYVPRGIVALAVKYQATIMPGFVWFNQQGGYSARVAAPIAISPDDPDATEARIAQRMFDAIELMIRRDPTQWYMFRPFWPDQIADGSR